jgi:hypothetical protein
MNNIQWIRSGSQISMVLKGEIVNVTKEHENFDNILKALTTKAFSKVAGLIHPVRKVKGVTIKGGQITYKGKVIDGRLGKKIMEMDRDKQPFVYLVNFIERLEQNPSEASRNDLYEFLEANNIPITPDGKFIAYKVVRSDFKDKYSGTKDNTPGKLVEMDRDKVDPDNRQNCSYGLHVCGVNSPYINFYGSNGDKVIKVLVDPKDAVAVPKDHSCQKIRVCEYKVLATVGNKEDVPTNNEPVSSVETTRETMIKALLKRDGSNRKVLIKSSSARLEKLYQKSLATA